MITVSPVFHKTLTEIVSAKLVTSILDGTLPSGVQLPAERELMLQLGVSRATLRESLKVLEQHKLIEARPNVGWFVCSVDEFNLAQAKEIAKVAHVPVYQKAGIDPLTKPMRVPIAREKPIHIPNLQTDRLGTFDFISWWERNKVQEAKVLVVGAGALGNEVIKISHLWALVTYLS